MPWYFNVVMNSEILRVFFALVLESFKDILFQKKIKLSFFSFQFDLSILDLSGIGLHNLFHFTFYRVILSYYPDHDFCGLVMLAWFIFLLIF